MLPNPNSLFVLYENKIVGGFPFAVNSILTWKWETKVCGGGGGGGGRGGGYGNFGMPPCNRSSSPHANSLLLKCLQIPFWTGNFVADSLRELHP